MNVDEKIFNHIGYEVRQYFFLLLFDLHEVCFIRNNPDKANCQQLAQCLNLQKVVINVQCATQRRHSNNCCNRLLSFHATGLARGLRYVPYWTVEVLFHILKAEFDLCPSYSKFTARTKPSSAKKRSIYCACCDVLQQAIGVSCHLSKGACFFKNHSGYQ